MAARVVRNAWNVVMIGADHHGGLYYYNIHTGLGTPPGPPIPHPPGLLPMPAHSFHFVMTSSAWPYGDHKINPTVIVEGDPIISKGHEAKFVPHIPPGGNLVVFVTIGFSASKWAFGVGSVQATAGPVASTLFHQHGANYNCQDPCSSPFMNLMVATASVQVSPTPADLQAAAVEMAMQSGIEMLISCGFEFGMPFLKLVYGKLITNRAASKVLDILGAGARRAGKAPAVSGLKKWSSSGLKRLAKPGLKKAAGIAKAYAVGIAGDGAKGQANNWTEKERSDLRDKLTGNESKKTDP